MRALQTLASRLAACNADARAELPMSEALREALVEWDRIRARDARRRHIRYLARLLDEREDVDGLREALERLDASSAAFARELHALERWREAMIADDAAVDAFVERFPRTERSRLQRLVREARAEAAGAKRAYRALFRFLRASAADAGALETLEGPPPR